MDTTTDRPCVIIPEPITLVCEACDREFEGNQLVAEQPFVVCPDCSVPR